MVAAAGRVDSRRLRRHFGLAGGDEVRILFSRPRRALPMARQGFALRHWGAPLSRDTEQWASLGEAVWLSVSRQNEVHFTFVCLASAAHAVVAAPEPSQEEEHIVSFGVSAFVRAPSTRWGMMALYCALCIVLRCSARVRGRVVALFFFSFFFFRVSVLFSLASLFLCVYVCVVVVLLPLLCLSAAVTGVHCVCDRARNNPAATARSSIGEREVFVLAASTSQHTCPSATALAHLSTGWA